MCCPWYYSIQDVLTELDKTLEQPGKGGHTLAQVVIR
jgi:hypothetical protein